MEEWGEEVCSASDLLFLSVVISSAFVEFVGKTPESLVLMRLSLDC